MIIITLARRQLPCVKSNSQQGLSQGQISLIHSPDSPPLRTLIPDTDGTEGGLLFGKCFGKGMCGKSQCVWWVKILCRGWLVSWKQNGSQSWRCDAEGEAGSSSILGTQQCPAEHSNAHLAEDPALLAFGRKGKQESLTLVCPPFIPDPILPWSPPFSSPI